MFFFKPFDREKSEIISKSLGIPVCVARILNSRGIDSPEEAVRFLSPRLTHLSDPFLIPNMKEGVRRLKEAVLGGERILIYGDYDADGLSGTALFYLFLKSLGCEVFTYIPHRIEEGHGISERVIPVLRENKINLMITVDCGVRDVEVAKKIKSLGVDIIITDHHRPGEELPPSLYIINPHIGKGSDNFQTLAGVGVAFMTCVALRKELRDAEWFRGRNYPNLKDYLDLVALGTVADIVPLIKENRIFVKYGLRLMRMKRRTGIRAILEASGLSSKELDAWDIAFRIAPRINAAGRLTHADFALKLLLCEDEEHARNIAEELNRLNSKRQMVEEDILKEAEEMIYSCEAHPVIFLAGEGWNPGVIGIVASRIVEKYLKPCIIVGIDGDVGIGSCRAPEGCDILEIIKTGEEFLISHGGHPSAAGFRIHVKNIDNFRSAILDRARFREEVKDREILSVDGIIDEKDLKAGVFSLFKNFEPFGEGNPRLKILLRKVILSRKILLKERHIKFFFRSSSGEIKGISFDAAERFSSLEEGKRYNVLFSPEIEVWNGNVYPLLIVLKIVEDSGSVS